MLSRAASAALLARGIGSTLIFIFEKRFQRYSLIPPEMINEDSIAALAQILVALLVFLGLKVN